MGKKKAKGSLGMQWFTTGVSTTLVLILLGIVSFFILFAQRLSDSVKENLTVTVLLDGEASRSDIHEFRRALTDERYVYALDYVSKEQALKEQVKAMGSDPSEFLGANPFTASFELRMNALYANSDRLAWITAKLKKNPLVEDVMYQKELVDTVNDNLRRISYVLLGLAVLLALVSFALINNTVRLSIYSGRIVIRTMKVVGACWGFIRRLFIRVRVRFVGRCCAVGRRTYPFAIRSFAFPIYPCRYVARRRGGGAVVRPFAYVGLYVPLRQQVSADESR